MHKAYFPADQTDNPGNVLLIPYLNTAPAQQQQHVI
jgi:hypothetical protein